MSIKTKVKVAAIGVFILLSIGLTYIGMHAGLKATLELFFIVTFIAVPTSLVFVGLGVYLYAIRLENRSQ
jgi:hypothetical protein